MSSNSRREFLQGTAATILPFFLRKPAIVPSLKELPVPEFWFGDRVSYFWIDENTEESHSETGEIVGAVWDSRENCWEYAVNWLSSTAYPADSYPIYDGGFVTAEEVCKL